MARNLLYKRTEIHGKNIRVYWQILGLRGTLATLANLVLGFPEHMTITPEGVRHPLFVRLGTSDVEVYRDTFLKEEYSYPIHFSPRTIVDVGANCGMTSVFYANRFRNPSSSRWSQRRRTMRRWSGTPGRTPISFLSRAHSGVRTGK